MPPKLRGIVGRPELRKWLGRDQRGAERAAFAIIADFHRVVDDAAATLAASAPTLRSIAQAHYASELLADDRERAVSTTERLVAYRKKFAPRGATQLRMLLTDQLSAEEEEAAVSDALDALIGSGHALPTTNRRAQLKAAVEAQLEAMARFEERDRGIVLSPLPSSPLLRDEENPSDVVPAAASSHRRPRATGKPLSALLSEFHAERTAGKGSMSPKTIKEHEVAVRMLEEFLGQGTAAASITHGDMLEYKRALMKTPANYRQRFPGKSLPEAIIENAHRSEPHPALNPQTINNKWLSHISALMGWCYNNGLLAENAARGVKVDEGKGFKEPTRTAFNPDELGPDFRYRDVHRSKYLRIQAMEPADRALHRRQVIQRDQAHQARRHLSRAGGAGIRPGRNDERANEREDVGGSDRRRRPDGLTLACELARRGVSVRLIEAAPGPQPGSRGKGLQPRTLEVFDDLGIVDRVLANGRMAMPMRSIAPDGRVTITGTDTLGERPDIPYPTTLLTPQWRVEEALRLRLAELGGAVEFGTTLQSFAQSSVGVTVVLVRDGAAETPRARWSVAMAATASSARRPASPSRARPAKRCG